MNADKNAFYKPPNTLIVFLVVAPFFGALLVPTSARAFPPFSICVQKSLSQGRRFTSTTSCMHASFFSYTPVQRTCSGSRPPRCQQGAMSTVRSAVGSRSRLKETERRPELRPLWGAGRAPAGRVLTPTGGRAAAQRGGGRQQEVGL